MASTSAAAAGFRVIPGGAPALLSSRGGSKQRASRHRAGNSNGNSSGGPPTRRVRVVSTLAEDTMGAAGGADGSAGGAGAGDLAKLRERSSMLMAKQHELMEKLAERKARPYILTVRSFPFQLNLGFTWGTLSGTGDGGDVNMLKLS